MAPEDAGLLTPVLWQFCMPNRPVSPVDSAQAAINVIVILGPQAPPPAEQIAAKVEGEVVKASPDKKLFTIR
jgi:hypothetical protein